MNESDIRASARMSDLEKKMKTLSLSKVNALPQYPDGNILYLTKKEKTLNLTLLDSTQTRPGVANRYVILSGPQEIYIDINGEIRTIDPVQYTITNFDSFETYNVKVSRGSVSITGNIITVSPDVVEGDLYLTVNGESSKIRVRVRGVDQASITYPYINNTEVYKTFDIYLSPFSSHNVGETCTTTEIQLSTSSDFTSGNMMLTYAGSTTMMTAHLDGARDELYIRARYTGNVTGAGPWSAVNKVIVYDLATAPLQETFEFMAPLAIANDNYGAKVAVSSRKEWLLVSAPYRNGKGTVSIYSGQGDFWELDTVLQPSDLPADAVFGLDVAISSDGKVIAISMASSSTRPGAVYIYTRSDTTWDFVHKVAAPIVINNDFFGASISLSDDGSYLVVGCIGDDTTAVDSGCVYVYKRGNLIWELKQTFKAPTATTSNYYGSVVRLSGNGTYLAVSELYGDTTTTNIGLVHIYLRTGETWALQTTLSESTVWANKRFGNGLAINQDGSIIAIGAPDFNAGVVFGYSRTATTWTKKSTMTGSNTVNGSKFGEVIAMSPDGLKIIIGAYAHGSNQGKAYLFQGGSAIYSEIQELVNIQPTTAEWFGYSVAMADSGKTVICGAPGSQSFKGTVNIFN